MQPTRVQHRGLRLLYLLHRQLIFLLFPCSVAVFWWSSWQPAPMRLPPAYRLARRCDMRLRVPKLLVYTMPGCRHWAQPLRRAANTLLLAMPPCGVHNFDPSLPQPKQNLGMLYTGRAFVGFGMAFGNQAAPVSGMVAQQRQAVPMEGREAALSASVDSAHDQQASLKRQ